VIRIVGVGVGDSAGTCETRMSLNGREAYDFGRADIVYAGLGGICYD
jgi:hypothetical protein